MFLIVCIDFLYFIYFFFFQAEDGIRDLYVTGVQTCALPISLSLMALRPEPNRMRICRSGKSCFNFSRTGTEGSFSSPTQKRSEERRVRKECRSRWSPYH